MSRASRYPFNPRIDATSFPRSDGPIPPFNHAMAQGGKPPPRCSNAPRPKCSPTMLADEPSATTDGAAPLRKSHRNPLPYRKTLRFWPRNRVLARLGSNSTVTILLTWPFASSDFPFRSTNPEFRARTRFRGQKCASLPHAAQARPSRPAKRPDKRKITASPLLSDSKPPANPLALRTPPHSPTTRRRRKPPPSPPSSASRSATTPTRSGGPLLSRHARRLGRRRNRPG